MPNLEGLKTKKSRRIVNQQQASEKQLRAKSSFLRENPLLHVPVKNYWDLIFFSLFLPYYSGQSKQWMAKIAVLVACSDSIDCLTKF